MESEINYIENNESNEKNFDILYQSFDYDIKKINLNNTINKKKNIDKYDTITFYYDFNNERIKYQTKIKIGDSVTLKKFIKDIYNRDLQ